MRIAIILALVMGLAACSSAPTPPSPAELFAACGGAEDDCPPVADFDAPGFQEPIYETRQEPIWEERRTPVWGEKTVGVYQTRKVPVTITVPDACTGCDREVTLWTKEERHQIGVKRVPACIGYRVERGHRTPWRLVEDQRGVKVYQCLKRTHSLAGLPR